MVVRPPHRSPIDIQKYRSATQAADRGRRAALYDIYDDLLIDTTLSSAIEKRIMAITNSEITFTRNGEVVEEMVNLIDTIEFEHILQQIMWSKFYGKTVGELEFTPKLKINNIKRQHLNTERKEILIQLSDQSGVSYVDDDFLLNIGDDNDLGLMLKTAPYAIFKRNGWGDFAQYVELFGIDTLVGLYDPEDENGRKEMEEAFRQRGSAGSITMSKNGDIKTIGTKSSGTVDIHDRFLERCDEAILIALLGQTMTTKNGSSYSQSKTHGETEDDINKADRRFVQRILNSELLPRMEKRGYNVAGGSFSFVEKGEALSKTQQLAIAKTVHHITDNVDEDYWFDNFGIPKGKKKKKKEPKEEPKPTEEKGKKEDLNSDISLFKRFLNFFVKAPTTLGANYKAKLNGNITDGISENDLFIKALEDIFDGNKDLVNKFLFKLHNDSLQNAVTVAWDEAGEEWVSENNRFEEKFRQKVAVFAGFKAHCQGGEIIQQLIDKNGNPRSFKDYKKAAQEITECYHTDWLRTEQNTVIKSARAAVNFRNYLKTEHLYPNLEYLESSSANKRHSHLEYVGTILPIRHEWWKTHMPPGDWNCNCGVRPTDKKATNVPGEELVNPVFANNPGETAEFVVINETSFFKHTDKELRTYIENETTRFFQQLEENKKIYEELKKDKDYINVCLDKTSGGVKASHLLHNFNHDTAREELKVQDILHKEGNSVILDKELPAKNEKIIDGIKIPDGTFNGYMMDISTIKGAGKNAIKRALHHTEKKGAEVAILYFKEKSFFSEELLNTGIAKFYGISKYQFKEIIYIVEDKPYFYKIESRP